MKKFYTLFFILVIAIPAFTQSPQKISYQAVVRNAGNTLITNQTVRMRVSILKSSATGTAVYVETHTPQTNSNGLAVIDIGGGTVVSGTFTSIDWSAGPYFLKTETDPSGGTNYTITGTSQLLSVPYALHAVKAESLTGKENLDQIIQRVLNLEEIFYRQLPAPGEGLLAFYPFKGNANDFSGHGWDGKIGRASCRERV